MKNSISIGLGSIYLLLIGFIWVLLFSVHHIHLEQSYYYTILYIDTNAGPITIIGGAFLIPSLIGNIKFSLDVRNTWCHKIGFIFGIVGWVVCFIGSIIGVKYPYYSYDYHLWSERYFEFTPYISTAILLCVVGLILTGILLYARIWENFQPVFETFTITPNSEKITLKWVSPCPTCHSTTRYISLYDRFYCDRCQKYL